MCIISSVSEQAFISLGSNIEPERYLPQAVGALRQLGRLLAVSAAYQNPAVGATAQPDFLNAAVLLDTELTPQALRHELRRLESRLGRRRTADKFAPRTIDLDLVLYGSKVIEETGLHIPDPDLLVRAHLAVLVAELAPDFRHPITGERLAAIASWLAAPAQLTLHAEVTQQIRLLAARLAGDEGSV